MTSIYEDELKPNENFLSTFDPSGLTKLMLSCNFSSISAKTVYNTMR